MIQGKTALPAVMEWRGDGLVGVSCEGDGKVASLAILPLRAAQEAISLTAIDKVGFFREAELSYRAETVHQGTCSRHDDSPALVRAGTRDGGTPDSANDLARLDAEHRAGLELLDKPFQTRALYPVLSAHE